MSIKQKLFVKKYLENNGNATEAAFEVYNVKNRNVAHSIGSENLRKPTIQQAIREALQAKGLTPESISEYLKEAIVSGLGQKSTNSDALRGIDLYAKLVGGYDQVSIQETYKMKLQRMNSKELQLELEKVHAETTRLIDDLRDLRRH